jgi:hypothetical protein
MRYLSAVGPLAFGVTIAVAGCSGGRSNDSTSSTPATATAAKGELDPCALVTKAEADQALGADATADRPSEANIGAGLLTCRYTAPRAQGVAVMTVMVRTGSSEAEAKSGFQGVCAVGETESVPGLGDEAFWLINQLYVLKGARTLTITGDFDKVTAQELAKKGLDRLP